VEVVLIRHGTTNWNRDKIFTGWCDVDLNATVRTTMDRYPTKHKPPSSERYLFDEVVACP
jgi:hypothetical protein